MDPVADLKGKEIKRATLNEIVDYITAGRGVLTEAVYPEIIRMVSGTLLMSFPISRAPFKFVSIPTISDCLQFIPNLTPK